MKLGLHNPVSNNLAVVRNLEAGELQNHEVYRKVTVEARNRLALFRMLDRNYKDLQGFINNLLTAGREDEPDDGEEIDRLLLNYLTFAYTIQEHFRVSYRRRHKKDQAALARYDGFIDKLCAQCWPFAFVLDFRGFVQHVSLGVGRFTRNVTRGSVTVQITADPERLVRDSADWKRSKITSDHHPIDLIETLHEFHIQMLQSYGSFVATTFFPELKPAAQFYGLLAAEAKQKDPNARMVFFTSDPQVTPEGGGKFRITADLVFPPNSLFEELGILYPKGKLNEPEFSESPKEPAAPDRARVSEGPLHTDSQ